VNASSVLGSSGKGIRDDQNIQIFRRKVGRRSIFLACDFGVVGLGGGMNVGGQDSSANGMTVTPPSAVLRAGDTTQFAAKVTGNMNQAVTWSVNGLPAGDATVGTIDATGKYKAPLSLPSPPSVTVKATSVADKSLHLFRIFRRPACRPS
jgi:hypothetical protein